MYFSFRKLSLGLAVVAGLITNVACAQKESYRADLTALNATMTGSIAKGVATFQVVGDTLKIHIKMTGTPANTQHWEHFHGYPDGKESSCATIAQDVNHDGLVDLVETGAVSGTTMVPFDASPEKMNIPNDTYPTSDSKGAYEYTKIVPLEELSLRFAEVYKDGKLNLANRVIYVHGVLDSSHLPSTVAGNVGSYDPHVTLPIACGKIRRVR